MKDLIEKLKEKRAALAVAKAECDKAEADLQLAISDNIKGAYKEKGEPFGTVEVFPGLLKCITPKKVTWDQDALRELAEAIDAAGDEVEEYIKVSYDVSETKYNAWPEEIRESFEPARTVAPGKIRFEIVGEEQ